MALAMQGLTSDSDEEKREIIDMIVNTDAVTGYLHEGFNAGVHKRVVYMAQFAFCGVC